MLTVRDKIRGLGHPSNPVSATSRLLLNSRLG